MLNNENDHNESLWSPPTKNLQIFLGKKIRIQPWSVFWVSINWSAPEISQERWRLHIQNASLHHYHHLENVIEFADKAEFLFFFGVENFLLYWPEIRGFSPQRLFLNRRKYDAMWSFALSPYPLQIPPLPTFNTLSKLERKLLIYVCNHPRITVSKIISESKLNQEIVEEMLSKLIVLKYLVRVGEMYGRSDFYSSFQVERPQRVIKYSVGNTIKYFTTSKNW